jgi:S-methylmethionine-dependent homocysteine/selenocysteine methylase
MARYRNRLPQLDGRLFLADGGIETTLIFHDGLDLPEFAAYRLLRGEAGRDALDRYFRSYLDVARRHRTGLVLESATWRASADWGARLGDSAAELAEANREAVRQLERIRDQSLTGDLPVVISGCVGPRGDGYVADRAMSEREAEEYHREQIAVFAETAADLIGAITMNYVEEAIGAARAAATADIPAAISFTVETDGRLPTGQSLKDAVEEVDDATGGAPAYFMVNCAHPTHFGAVLASGEPWTRRIRGVRANASRRSHAELDGATDLDAGDPAELGRDYRELLRALPGINVVGGCCGTDHRHVEAICRSLAPDHHHAHAA